MLLSPPRTAPPVNTSRRRHRTVQCTHKMTAHPRAVPRLRGKILRWCAGHHVPQLVRQDAETITAVLATSALALDCVLEVRACAEVTGGQLTLTMTCPGAHCHSGPCGPYGPKLLDAMTDTWGAGYAADGPCAWARLTWGVPWWVRRESSPSGSAREYLQIAPGTAADVLRQEATAPHADTLDRLQVWQLTPAQHVTPRRPRRAPDAETQDGPQ